MNRLLLASVLAEVRAASKPREVELTRDQILHLRDMAGALSKLSKLRKPDVNKDQRDVEFEIFENIGAFLSAALASVQWVLTHVDPSSKTQQDAFEEAFEETRNVQTHYQEWALHVRPFTASTLTEFIDYATNTLDVIEEAFLHGKPATQKKTLVPGTKMAIVNAAGYSKQAVAALLKTCAKAAALIKSKGAGYILYGNILLVKPATTELTNQPGRKRLDVLLRKRAKSKVSKGTVGAYYNIKDDSLVIQSTLADVEHADMSVSEASSLRFLNTILHELAHRIEFKFPAKLLMDTRRKLYLTGRDDLGRYGLGASMPSVVEKELYQFVSPYSTSDAKEMFAEAFACHVSPDYYQKRFGLTDTFVKQASIKLGTYWKTAGA
jgi:hypothetical protein